MVITTVIICCLRCAKGTARGMNPSPPPKQVRQWWNVAYLPTPSCHWLSSAWDEGDQGASLSTKRPWKVCCWSQLSLWPEIRLILKQIYGFGFSPELTGHYSRSRFQNSSWPAVSCLGYPQEHPGLLRIAQPKCLGTRPDSLRPFLVLLGSQFWARTCSKRRCE